MAIRCLFSVLGSLRGSVYFEIERIVDLCPVLMSSISIAVCLSLYVLSFLLIMKSFAVPD